MRIGGGDSSGAVHVCSILHLCILRLRWVNVFSSPYITFLEKQQRMRTTLVFSFLSSSAKSVPRMLSHPGWWWRTIGPGRAMLKTRVINVSSLVPCCESVGRHAKAGLASPRCVVNIFVSVVVSSSVIAESLIQQRVAGPVRQSSSPWVVWRNIWVIWPSAWVQRDSHASDRDVARIPEVCPRIAAACVRRITSSRLCVGQRRMSVDSGGPGHFWWRAVTLSSLSSIERSRAMSTVRAEGVGR